MALISATGTKSQAVLRLVITVALFTLPGLPVYAQSPEDDDADASVDEIVVVGTHIRQADPDGPSPVTIFDRDALERSGAPTVGMALGRLPFGNDGSFNDSDALSSAIGGTGISFRGLGANAVLVLINGRRVTPYGFTFNADTLVSFVDLNSIPIAAVEKIEVLRDGASAIYGSDAIAGVINIVLREDVSGVEIEGQYGYTTDTGANELSVSALMGFAGTQTSAEIIATYTEREHLFWRDRAISQSGNHTDSGGEDLRTLESANFNINGNWSAYGAECEERESIVSGYQDFELLDFGLCVYDPNRTIAEPRIERLGLMTIVNHELREEMTLHFEGTFQTSEVRNQTLPHLQVGDNFPIDNPWNPFPDSVLDFGPFGEPLLPYAYAFTEAGPQIDEIKTDTTRLVLSLEGYSGIWVWEVGVLYNESDSSRLGKQGYLGVDKIDAALNGVDLDGDGILQPNEYWNPYSAASNTNSAELTNTMLSQRSRHSTTELLSLDGLVSGDLRTLPHGQMRGAIGFELRRDSLHDVSDQLSLDDQLAKQFPPLFWGIRLDSVEDIEPDSFLVQELDESLASTAIGDRNQVSIFGELQIPVLANLDLQLALRFEDYSDFGTDLNPRIAIRYQPWSRLTLRGSWGRSFRAPSLPELYIRPSASMFAAWDPRQCPALSWVNPPFVACIYESFEYVTSGNASLEAEESESLSVGFTVNIANGIDLSANFWRIDHKNRIVSPGLDLILANELLLGPDFVERNPPDFEEIEAGVPGNIERVNNWFVNLAENQVRGIDIDATFERDIGDIGKLSSRLLWTILQSSKYAFNANDPLQELAGTYGHPENRATLDTYLSTNEWEFGIYGRWTDGYDDSDVDNSVASHVEWDAQISNYSFDRAKITLGITNIFDTAPPFSEGGGNSQGYNTQYYNMRGRMIYGRVRISL